MIRLLVIPSGLFVPGYLVRSRDIVDVTARKPIIRAVDTAAFLGKLNHVAVGGVQDVRTGALEIAVIARVTFDIRYQIVRVGGGCALECFAGVPEHIVIGIREIVIHGGVVYEWKHPNPRIVHNHVRDLAPRLALEKCLADKQSARVGLARLRLHSEEPVLTAPGRGRRDRAVFVVVLIDLHSLGRIGGRINPRIVGDLTAGGAGVKRLGPPARGVVLINGRIHRDIAGQTDGTFHRRIGRDTGASRLIFIRSVEINDRIPDLNASRD